MWQKISYNLSLPILIVNACLYFIFVKASQPIKNPLPAIVVYLAAIDI